MKHLLRLTLLIASIAPALAYRDLETGVFLSRDPSEEQQMNPDDVWIVNGQKIEAKPSQMQDPMQLAAIFNNHDNRVNPTQSAKAETGKQYEQVMQAQYGDSPQGFVSITHYVPPAKPNLYAYVQDNPWTMFDPEGLDAVPVGGGDYKFVVNPANFGQSSLGGVQGMVKGKFVANPNPNYTGQCAVGAQYLTGTKVNGQMHDAPSTTTWSKGPEMSPQTQPGTMVAWGWDANGKYPSTPSGNHTAIFAGTDKNGNMMVTEQNVKSGDSPNREYHTRTLSKNDPTKFYEVHSKQTVDKKVSDSSIQNHK